MAETGIKAVKDFFGLKSGQTLKDFKAEWDELSDESKAQLREGIVGGSLTY